MITIDEYVDRHAQRIAQRTETDLTTAADIARREYLEAKEHCSVAVDAWRYRVINQRLGRVRAEESVTRWLDTNGAKTQEQAQSLGIDIVGAVIAR